MLPLSPLFSRQTSDETPSEPAISTISLWVSLVELAHLVQDRGGVAELGLGQPHLAHEAVQVAHQRDHDLAQARIGGPLHDLDDGVRQLLLTLDDHSLPPACVLSQTALIGYRR